MSTHIVEMDDRGRVLIPKRLRESIGSRRFLLIVKDGKMELIPLDDPKEALKKLKGSRQFPFNWEEAKRIAERLVNEEVAD
ncbi:MAG: AbrB/MazE/SpoVT family DNA-binding domain-containing protein [Candidatus Korarchaeota archaeon NZ13-K]|nr:MAG: AbrB/MazE/SpoVT family DNA-binding domain-containing protein [Candidatus Korarchaeota archaeon NZ13-K]